MAALTEEQAKSYITKLLTAMSAAGGSDLFISKDFPPSMKMQGAMKPLINQKLTGEIARDLAYALMNERQREEFARDLEANFALSLPGVSRFRVNVFMQQQNVGMVVRTIVNQIPDLTSLGLPDTLKDIVMTKRGLVLVVGATGSGKSTSLAAMIHHRNLSSAGTSSPWRTRSNSCISRSNLSSLTGKLASIRTPGTTPSRTPCGRLPT